MGETATGNARGKAGALRCESHRYWRKRGRGAMGVTYKAFDVDLHCPVTLKVISDAPAMELAR